ncbi:MAG: TrmH family RNA methyltransferase [Rhodothermales bacterium]
MKLLHLSEQRRKEIASLGRKKGRVQHGQMLVEGWRSVQSALLAEAPLSELLVTEKVLENEEMMDIITSSKKIAINDLPVYEISEKAARLISSVETTQGIFAVAGIEPPALSKFESMKRIIALDGVQDPGNVGTIIRTAAWFGIEGVLASEATADFYNPKVIRSSMGGLWDITLARVANLPGTLNTLKEAGMQMVCADLNGKPLADWQPATQTVLVVGGEANGISKWVQSVVDAAVTIPGAEHKKGAESLNAGMAAGIIMHHWAQINS